MNSTVKLLDGSANEAVVHLRERKYPGVVIQGDTLFNLYSEAQEILEMLDIRDSEEAAFITRTLIERLGGFLEHYEAVCLSAGLELPYVKTKLKE
jgi:hypothetical protein